MKNLMDEYINFTTKRIKKYIKLIFRAQYIDGIVEEYLKTYINARYYNITEEGAGSRAFYLKITDALNEKENLLKKKYVDEKEVKFLQNVKKVFYYILFFDNVRKVENFKNITSVRELIKQLMVMCKTEFGLKVSEDLEDTLYKEIASDVLTKDIYLDKFESDEFYLSFRRHKTKENIYYIRLDHDLDLPIQYSDSAIEQVYNTGIIAEDKLQIEYTLLNVVVIRDIVNGNFKDKYVVDFPKTLFKKEQKANSILSIINNQALQDKILLNITYQDCMKYRSQIVEYVSEGYNFVITLDDYVKSIEDVQKLKMFEILIVPKNIKMHNEIMKNKKILSNIVEE